VEQLKDETVEAVRTRGPVPLPLDGWDQASIWGWDEAAGSLYAHLRRNTDDTTPTIRIEPEDFTPAIPFCATLAQYIAMVTSSDPWDVLAVLHETAQLDDGENEPLADDGGGTIVTMTDSYSPP
jgi:hypothetical protein